MRVSILDDYQGVALDMADWSPVRGRGIEIAVERFPFADEDDVVRSLADSEIVCAMRERTAFPQHIVERLVRHGGAEGEGRHGVRHGRAGRR
jgi:hypothetical protein